MSFTAELAAHDYSREWVSCARKVLIVEKKDASRQATKMSVKHKQMFVSYQCRYCGGYHVGRIGVKNEARLNRSRVKHTRNALRLMQSHWVQMWGEA